jgi:hypothetical protein
MDSALVPLSSVKFDAPGSNIPAFDIALPAGADPEEEAKKIVSGGGKGKVIPISSVKFDQEEATTPRALSAAKETGKILVNLAAPWVAWPVSKVAGGIRSIQSGSAAEGTDAEAEAYRKMTDIYQPDTEAGKNLLAAVGKVFSIPAEVAKELISLPLESWKASGAAKYIPTAIAEFGSYMVAGKAGAKAKEGIRGATEVTGLKDVLEPIQEIRTPREPGKTAAGIEKAIISGLRTDRPRGVVPLEKVKFDAPEEVKAGEPIPLESVKFDEPATPPQSAPVESVGTREAPPVPEIVQPGATSQAEAAKPEATGITGDVTGIKNRITEAERAARGLEEVESEAIKVAPTYQAGRNAIASGAVDPKALAKELAQGKRAHTPEEAGVLVADRVKLQNEHRATMRQIEIALDSGDVISEAQLRQKLKFVEDDLDANETAAKKSGTLWSAMGRMRQIEAKSDYSLAAMVRKAKVATGKDVTPEMRAKLESLSKQIEEAQAKITAYEEKAAQTTATKAVERIKNDVSREKRQTSRVIAKEVLDQEFDLLIKDFNKAIGGQLNVGIDPAGVAILGKMAKNRVQKGYLTAEEIVDDIYTSLKNAGMEFSKRDIRDAISGYGITAKMSQKELDIQMREARRQMRLISALEDAMKKEAPLRSGLQRDVPSDRVRDLQRQVKEAMKEAGIESKSPEDQWKSSLDAIKTRLTNRAADLTRQIESGKRDNTKPAVKYDAEATKLKEEAEFLNKVMQAVTPEEKIAIEKPVVTTTKPKREISPEERVQTALKAAERAVGKYAQEVAEGQKKKTPKQILETPELIEARQRRDEWKEIVTNLREIAKPLKTPEERALQAFKTRAKNRIVELDQRIKDQNFAKKEKREAKLDEEATHLRFQLDKAIKSYHESAARYAYENRSTGQKIWENTKEVSNVLRAIKTSLDLSAVLRQGGFIAFGHPIRALKAFPDMFRALRSEEGRFAVDQEILARPNYGRYEKYGLFLSEHGNKLSAQEEVYMSHIADKIPGVGASERAYTTFLNRLRADSFDAMERSFADKGTPEEYAAIANFVNIATGRGAIGGHNIKIIDSMATLNSVFFAPRYVLSRFQLLAGQPMYRGSLQTRMKIAKEYGRFLTGLSVVYMLGKSAGGTIEADPRSSEFGKIRFGNTRVDPLAGLSQTAVLISRIASGKTKTAKGRIESIRGDKVKFGTGDTASLIGRFTRGKLAPVVGIAFDLASGRNVVGQKVDMSYAAGQLVPLALSDIYSVMQDQGVPAGTAFSILSIFGMGLQTYDSYKRQK